MAQETPDIRVLVGVEGGASIDGKSGKLIASELAQIAKNISSQRAPQIAFTVNTKLTSQNIQNQLNEIVKGIKVSPLNLNIQTDKSSIQSSLEREYLNIIGNAKGTKTKINAVAYAQEKQALAELAIQKAKDAEATDRQRKEIKSYLSEFEKFKKATKSLNTSENYASKLGNSDVLSQVSGLKDRVAVLNKQVKELYENTNQLENIGEHINDDKFIKLAKEVKEVNKAVADLQKKATADNPLFVKNERISKNARDLSEFALSLNKFAKANDKFRSDTGAAIEFERISSAIDDLKRRNKLGEDIGIDLNILKKRTNDWKLSLESAGITGQTTFGKLRAQIEKLGVYFGASAIMMGAWQQIKTMTNNVIELDTAMTELKKVTDETDVTYSQFLTNAESRAKSIGASLTDTVTATADFARLGFSLSEAETISDAALVYKNVGDSINDINEASQSVISTMKAFGIEASDAMSIVDRFNEVGNNFAISSKGVGDALMRSASALAVAGNDINQSIALITAGNEIVQDPDVVGKQMCPTA